MQIGKQLAEKSKGLFSAEDWQCSKCGNINWARQVTRSLRVFHICIIFFFNQTYKISNLNFLKTWYVNTVIKVRVSNGTVTTETVHAVWKCDHGQSHKHDHDRYEPWLKSFTVRRDTCNVCNGPKVQIEEERTGLGGGFNERENVEYKRHNEDEASCENVVQ